MPSIVAKPLHTSAHTLITYLAMTIDNELMMTYSRSCRNSGQQCLSKDDRNGAPVVTRIGWCGVNLPGQLDDFVSLYIAAPVKKDNLTPTQRLHVVQAVRPFARPGQQTITGRVFADGQALICASTSLWIVECCSAMRLQTFHPLVAMAFNCLFSRWQTRAGFQKQHTDTRQG